ncbi:MAG: ABC transporter substrate-binding protein [Clostridiales bacterium]|nr:ABC transporter substrate-binding protein [Clostridiales bacterium]
MKKLVSVLLMLAMVFSFILPALAAEETIKIGGIGCLTGAYAMYGIGVKNGVDLYIDEINAAGGIDGKLVEMVWEDEEGDPAKATNAYSKLVENDGVVAIIGSVLTTPTDAVADYAAEDEMPLITASATAYYVTTDRPTVFRTCFIDPFQGYSMANFVKEEFGATKLAVLYENGNEYSVGLKDTFMAQAEVNGQEIVAIEATAAKDVDFKAQLTKIKDAAPEVVFLPYYGPEAALILTQANELGLDVKFVGADGISSTIDSISDKSLLKNMWYSDHFSNDADSDMVKNFLAGYVAKYGEEPSISFSATGYDAALVMCEAIKAAGSTEPEAIVEALRATNVEGVSGLLTFDDHNDPIKSAFILNFNEEGEQVFVKQQNP